MAQIKKIYDDAAMTNQVYPQTHEKAVVDNDGTTAETKFGTLFELYKGLTQSDIIVVANHTTVASPQANTIYREQGEDSYTDWMYYDSAWKKLAEYDSALNEAIEEAMDKAFVNWNDDAIGVTNIYSNTISGQTHLSYSSYTIADGSIIRIKAKGSGSLIVYVYWTRQSTPKTQIASITGSGESVTTLTYASGYSSYDRITFVPTGTYDVKLDVLSEYPEDMSFSDKLWGQIRNDKITNYVKNETVIFENATSDKTVHRTASSLSDFYVGGYIKVVTGNGTTGTWRFFTYSTSQSAPTVQYTSSMQPNSTYYFKIVADFHRLYFENNSTDAPISAYLLNYLQNDIRDINAKTYDFGNYYQKGQSAKSFSGSPMIIVAGQSNAEGRVPAEDLPEYVTLPDSNVKVWSGSSWGNLSTGYFSSDKWAFDIITAHFLGLQTQCYFVKRTKGATHLHKVNSANEEAWSADYEGLGTSLLQSLEWYIRGAMGSQVTADVRAFLWHQGEGDYTPPTVANYYYSDLKKFIAYIRGVCGNSRLPFISGTISHLSGQYSSIVEAAQLKVAQEDPYVTYIDMSGAPLLDSYHFNAASSEYFGKMAYNALIDYGVISAEKLTVTRPW